MSHSKCLSRNILRTTRALHAAGLALACLSAPAMAADAQDSPHAIADFNSCAKPHYPQADLQARHEGTVTLNFLVGPDGTVKESKVAKSSGYASMDEAARAAIAQCRFHPAVKAGKPIEKWTEVRYVWSLQ